MPQSSRNDLDELRARLPNLGFAIYAMEPGGDVTFEVHSDGGSVFAFVGQTLAAAIAAAFPTEPVLAPPPAPPPPPAVNVFD